MHRGLSALFTLGLMGCGTESSPEAQLDQVRKEGRQGQAPQGLGSSIRVTRILVNPLSDATHTGSDRIGTTEVTKIWVTGSQVKATTLIPAPPSPGGQNSNLERNLAGPGVEGLEFNGRTFRGTLLRMKIVKHKMDTDPSINMMGKEYSKGNGGGSVNASEVHLYEVMFRVSPTEWTPLCGSHPDPVTNNAAMFFKGYWRWPDPNLFAVPSPSRDGQYQDDDNYLSVGCWDGTEVKCARWGYFPWKSLPHSKKMVPLKDLHLACTRAAMADYCGNGLSHTQNGTIIDISDQYGFIPPVPEDTDDRDYIFSEEALFNQHGAPCLVRERYEALPKLCITQNLVINPQTSCSGDCTTTTIPITKFDRGHADECPTDANHSWLIRVANQSDTCSHSPFVTGADDASVAGRGLAIDCNYCTRRVCGTDLAGGEGNMPACCALDVAGYPAEGAWTPECAAQATAICKPPKIHPSNFIP